jgi:hypothetical protein
VSFPRLEFASPRALPRPGALEGRVVVLDVAFAAQVGGGVSFESVTLPFIEGLGDRLAAWIDHHDHERHVDFAGDPRFTLATKAEHGACPEMVTPELVRQAGPIDTIIAHVDLDGLYSAAKWICEGKEPYRGADDDARCVDTRTGEPGPVARLVDRALRARFRDADLKRAVVRWLVGGMPEGAWKTSIAEAAAAFEQRDAGTRELTRRFTRHGRVALVDARGFRRPFDKTELLLAGQKQAPVSVVHDSGFITVAAGFDSGWDFVSLLGLEGGMPTRVTVPEAELERVLALINQAPLPTAR